MAQSRLEKIGTIFTRVQGLLRGGAMKAEDKPIWYDVYAAFPPKVEPRFDRVAPQVAVKKIFYVEDVIRAKLHRENKPQETISLLDNRRSSQSQQFVQIYQNLKTQGALDDQKIYETALDLLAEQRQQSRLAATTEEAAQEIDTETKTQLLSDFKEASESQATKSSSLPPTPKSKREAGVGINIDSLFKD
ncbi:hypothetical protein KR074_012585 [Drosophila pseudoananassae]|nr:hypothetical protein KR074_012585 [Drosophila pseudoananassae]